MHLRLLAVVSVLLIIISLASSQPVRYYEADKDAKARDCELLTKASYAPNFDWSGIVALSLAECLIHTKPQHDSCVFYTSDSKLNAVRYAYETNKTTIYDVYAPHHFDVAVEPMRRWKRDGHQRDLFRITSKAYALACSGEARVVMPEYEEACPGSIWVTDEYEVIRNRESRIELPVYRVSWAEDKLNGAWGWAVRILSRGSQKRGLVGGAQVAVLDIVEDISEEVSRRMEVLKKVWRFDGQAVQDDLWSLREGNCQKQ